MFGSRCAMRHATRLGKDTTRASRQASRRASTIAVVSPRASRPQQRFVRSVAVITLVGAIAISWRWQFGDKLLREVYAEEPDTGVAFEKSRRQASSKEENRDLISSQHQQVKRSWENPGLYAWGSNSGRVAAPDSDESFVKTPRRIPFFDGKLLRDVKLDQNFGVAIAENGDLLQWGVGYSKDVVDPVCTLKGKNLKSLAISRDRVIGLASDGSVYSIPVSRDEQQQGPYPDESTWIPFWKSKSNISYRRLDPKSLSWGEKVTAIAGGLEHVLLLTSNGRLFTAASGSNDFPSKGQLGIPGLTWNTRPSGSYDQPHEVIMLRGFEIAKIAAGDHHSLVADKAGRVFSFGDNSFGQLGFDANPDSNIIDVPSLLPIQKLYAGTNQTPQVTNVAAGGSNSYFTIDATKVASQEADPASPQRNLGRVTADTWSCGRGIWGGLGNGRWTHIQGTPTKMASLSGLFEWDEKRHRAIPIRLSRLSVGATHAAAVMDNVTHLDASVDDSGSENDTNWGADILFFGNNEFYQLGTGKRNNVSSPTYIQPLDVVVAERKGRGKQEHRFHITPRKRVRVGGRWVSVEQRVECGRGVTAVYSGV